METEKYLEQLGSNQWQSWFEAQAWLYEQDPSVLEAALPYTRHDNPKVRR